MDAPKVKDGLLDDSPTMGGSAGLGALNLAGSSGLAGSIGLDALNEKPVVGCSVGLDASAGFAAPNEKLGFGVSAGLDSEGFGAPNVKLGLGVSARLGASVGFEGSETLGVPNEKGFDVVEAAGCSG